jgi:hypothetical protein
VIELEDIRISTNAVHAIWRNLLKLQSATVEGFTHEQVVPADVWGPMEHGLDHLPNAVSVWIDGQLAHTEVEATETHVTIRFNGNYSGTLKCL